METLQLRDYQQESLDSIAAMYRDGIWSQLVSLPTGAGKTVVFAELPGLLPSMGLSKRTLVLAHREELLDQAAEKIAKAHPGLRVDVDQASRKANAWADVIVASVPTLAARDGARLARLRPEAFGAVVVDEAHHATADTYHRVLAMTGRMPPLGFIDPKSITDAPEARDRMKRWWSERTPGLLLGVTATPMRGDGVGLEWVFQRIAFQRTIRDLVEAQWLAPLRGYLVTTGTDLSSVKTIGGDFNAKQLAEAVNTDERNTRSVQAWAKLADSRKTIAFTVDVQHAKDLAGAFSAAGVRAGHVSGVMSSAERASVLRQFRAGEIQVLANCAILTEGFDEPSVGCILHARPTKSPTLYMQMTGRGTRLFPGKADCIVIDMADLSRKHSLMGLTDIFGLPKLNLNGRDAIVVKKAIEEVEQGKQVLLTGLDDVTKYIQAIDLWNVRESETVKQYASLTGWRESAPGMFTISLPVRDESGAFISGKNDVLRLTQDQLGKYAVQLYSADGTSRALGDVENVARAFEVAESWVGGERPELARMADRNARWRDKEASDKQVALLRKFGAPASKLEGITRGEASALIDSIMAKRRRA